MHIEHLEDLAFSLNGHELTNLCSALIHHVYGSGMRGAELSVKHDGICVVFGIDDECRYFISTKSFFNKTPIRYYSIEDIENSKRDPDHKEKLKWYFSYFFSYVDYSEQDIYFICDVIRDPFSKIDEYSSRPNIIEYRLKNPFYSDILADVHAYKGLRVSTYIPNIHSSIFLNPNKELLEYHLYNLNLADPLSFHNTPEKMKKEVNKLIREGIPDYHRKIKECSGITSNFQKLTELKYYMLTYLDQNVYKPYECFIDDEPCSGEGYVFKYQDYVVKLVDRMVFSRKNFDPNTKRGWTKENL